jgi:hypothetical protein
MQTKNQCKPGRASSIPLLLPKAHPGYQEQTTNTGTGLLWTSGGEGRIPSRSHSKPSPLYKKRLTISLPGRKDGADDQYVPGRMWLGGPASLLFLFIYSGSSSLSGVTIIIIFLLMELRLCCCTRCGRLLKHRCFRYGPVG